MGLVDGAVLGHAFTQVVQRSGGRVLAELPKLNIPYQGGRFACPAQLD